jgi:hypothetical protein
MGKISDIWVRLGLKKEGFDKGMDDAVRKTDQTREALHAATTTRRVTSSRRRANSQKTSSSANGQTR